MSAVLCRGFFVAGRINQESVMKTIKTVKALQTELDRRRREGLRVGFVPTMGCLHEGHLSLVAQARKTCDLVVLSIFVNPAQFSPGESEGYPRDLAGDCRKCRATGVDVLFVPRAAEIYPPGFATQVTVSGPLTAGLCGATRDGHFDGVATVVAKLFNIVGPGTAFFGQKDAQQLAVVRQMARDLNLPLRIIGCPTLREPSGLAMSSRNLLLSPEDRVKAAVIWKSLQDAGKRIQAGERSGRVIEDKLRREILAAGAERVDYASVVDPDSLAPLTEIQGPALLAVAAFFGGVRLIDNLTVPG